MRIKTLEEIQQALEIHGTLSAAARALGCDRRNLIRRLKRAGIEIAAVAQAEPEMGDDALPNTAVVDLTKSKYIITSALNDTPIHMPFYKALQDFAEKNNAQLLVVPQRYKNVTLMQGTGGAVWSADLPFTSVDNQLSPRVVLAGCARVQATSSRPLSGYGGYGKGRSVIIGHSRIALSSIPRLLPDPAQYAITTGSISVAQYSDTKQGSLGMFHHVNAALLIELDRPNSSMWFRHLYLNEEEGVVNDPLDDIHTLILGDLHVGHNGRSLDRPNWNAVTALKTENTVIHDIFDGFSISHHHMKDPFLQMAKAQNGTSSLLLELQSLATHLKDLQGKVHIVESNHHEHLDQWLASGAGRTDPVNMHLYHWLAFQKCDEIRTTGRYSVSSSLKTYLVKYAGFPEDAFVGRNKSLNVFGIELSQHGDRGANGSRTLTGNEADRTISGHRHSPSIHGGQMTVGTSSTYDLGYNKGYSSWAHCHAIITKDGQRVMFNVEDGKCRM